MRYNDKMYSISEIFSRIPAQQNVSISKLKRTGVQIRQDFDGAQVSVYSGRYSAFLKSTSCARCGLKATYFRIEASMPEDVGLNRWHFNLYGISKSGEEVLFTKDHIIPIAKGGADHTSNYQTMCRHCNASKGDDADFVAYHKNMETVRRLLSDIDIKEYDSGFVSGFVMSIGGLKFDLNDHCNPVVIEILRGFEQKRLEILEALK